MFQLFWCGNGNSLKWQKKKSNTDDSLASNTDYSRASTVQFLSSAGAVTEDEQEDF